ncbi:spermatogenesis associated 6-like protein isoform X1 [Poecilia formosa]|uniref:spermatogenesis associated 6-like protein isoform X1 n=1 Tax=Poecilia formosa TaxID=48698 RepID=UPI0007B8FABE|nr:PREDICTED: spermatogenesis associated 6-like protein isoform X1 [Poecilia formosa]
MCSSTESTLHRGAYRVRTENWDWPMISYNTPDVLGAMVSCPGVHLSVKDDVYLNMFFMDQFRQSLCVPAVFPLLFHEEITFEKIFRHAVDPGEIAVLLEYETVRIELVQLIPPAGDTLAFFEEDARSFLFPEPKLVPSFSGVDREVLMTRAAHFFSIAPRLEFSTKTTISECPPDTKVTTYCNTPLWPGKRRNKRHATSTPHWTAEGERSVRMASPLSYIPRSQSLSPLRDGYIPSLARLSMGSAPCNPTDWETTSSQPMMSSWLGASVSASPKCSTMFTSRSSSPLTRSLSTVSHSSASRRFMSRSLQVRGTSEFDSRYLGAHESFDPVPLPLHLSYRELPHHSSSHSSWEELHERVQGLLTTPKAVQRLAYGATVSEADEVLARRFVSAGPQT